MVAELYDATRPGDFDGIIDVTLISRSESTSMRWNVQGAQNSDHLPCIVLILKRQLVRQVRSRHDFRRPRHTIKYVATKNPSDPLFFLHQKARQKTC